MLTLSVNSLELFITEDLSLRFFTKPRNNEFKKTTPRFRMRFQKLYYIKESIPFQREKMKNFKHNCYLNKSLQVFNK